MAILILLILGLCAGSFVNAFVWRLHNKKDWIKGRSVCIHCKHKLSSADLIPVLSWLWLGGKCRYCNKPISSQYPIVEILVAVAFVFSYIYWPSNLSGVEILYFALWLVFIVGFTSMALYDLKWMLLPNKILKPLYVLAGVQVAIMVVLADSFSDKLLAVALSFLIGFGLFYALFQISSGKWIGGGDVKLGGLLALVLASPAQMAMTIFSASVLGSAISVPMIISGKAKRNTRIPFGPFLIIGCVIAKLFGDSIINWYQQKIIGL